MSDLFVTVEEKGVQNVHLMTGEDVIGDVRRFPKDGIVRIMRPTMPHIAPAPDQSGYRVGLLPLRPYLGKIDFVDVPEAQIAYMVPAGDKMTEMWRQYTSEISLAGPGTLNQLLNPSN